MILPETEFKEFLKVHLNLLFYVGRQTKIFPKNTKFDAFSNFSLQKKFKCREAFLDNETLLDDYLSLNIDHLTERENKILSGFKKKISSDFILFKCLTNTAIFIDTKDNKFYAVKALSDPFYTFFNRFPALAKATILPYNDKIIYDGFIQPYNVSLGPQMTSTIKSDYQKAKRQKQILTTL